jgi:hypothetical protein
MPFDIRQLADPDGLDVGNPLIQGAYDVVNRMIAVTRGATFEALFTGDVESLTTHLEKNLDGAARFALNPDKTLIPLKTLREKYGRYSLKSLGERVAALDESSPDADRVAIDNLLRDLWGQGVFLNYPKDSEGVKTLNTLLRYGPGLSYCAIYTQDEEAISKRAIVAVRAAQERELLLNTPNYRCRAMSGGSCACNRTMSAKWCSCKAIVGGCVDTDVCGLGCCAGSQECARPRPRRRA